jgi:hypothetical protein
MNFRPFAAGSLACGALVALFWAQSTCHVAAADPDLKLEAQLIWGTNDPQSPDPKHKAVDPDVLKKLSALPLKWSNYFSVNRKGFSVSPTAPATVPLSDKCRLEVKHLGGAQIEVALFGKGEQVLKRTQALPKGEILVLAGNAPNDTAWLVTLKRVE